MKNSLTIALLTARVEPKFDWLFDSLANQVSKDDRIKITLVDFKGKGSKYLPDWDSSGKVGGIFSHSPPKPSIWQGEHRLTKEEWWDKSGYINTAIAMCRTEWIALLDDRCVAMPGFFDAISDAMEGNYCVAGKYEKRINMAVDNGKIVSSDQPKNEHGQLIGLDPRMTGARVPRKISGSQLFGCCYALPVEWMLQVNGSDESTSPTGLEDCILGDMLERNHYDIRYDERMFIIEDRTPGQVESWTKRCDKGPSPADRSHAILKRCNGKLAATHHLNLRALRESIQSGGTWPIPEGPQNDWFDGQPLSEFKEYH